MNTLLNPQFWFRTMYISGGNILVSHQKDVLKRVKLYQDLFKASNIKVLTKKLTQTNADYIYLWQRNELNATESEMYKQLFPKTKNTKNL